MPFASPSHCAEFSHISTYIAAMLFPIVQVPIHQSVMASHGRVCHRRALLKDATIVALDEATANVDLKTDAMIQTMLRVWVDQKRAVGGKVPTVLTIAHRIDTIMDCDLLLVLDGGELIEFGSPTKLMSMIGGKFSGMVEAAHIAAVPPFTITEDN